MNGEGWSTRRAEDGETEYNANDGRGWYRYHITVMTPGKCAIATGVYVDQRHCPWCNTEHPPPYDGGCLL